MLSIMVLLRSKILIVGTCLRAMHRRSPWCPQPASSTGGARQLGWVGMAQRKPRGAGPSDRHARAKQRQGRGHLRAAHASAGCQGSSECVAHHPRTQPASPWSPRAVRHGAQCALASRCLRAPQMSPSRIALCRVATGLYRVRLALALAHLGGMNSVEA